MQGIELKQNRRLNDFEMDECSYERVYPGPIECGDILELYPRQNVNLAIDVDKVKHDSNLVLKKNMQENKDFLILPVPVGQILHNSYGGTKLKRVILIA